MTNPNRFQSLQLTRLLGDRPIVAISQIEITEEPIRGINRNMPRAISDRATELVGTVHSRPADAIPILKDLIGKYPKVPQLYNWLATAYADTGQIDLAEQTALYNYQHHRDYLFARLNYAQFLLLRGDVEAVPDVFDGKMDLSLLYPNRRRFHITEYISFASILAQYLMAVGEDAAANQVYDTMREMAPDNPLVKETRRQLYPSLLRKLRRALQKRISPPQ